MTEEGASGNLQAPPYQAVDLNALMVLWPCSTPPPPAAVPPLLPRFCPQPFSLPAVSSPVTCEVVESADVVVTVGAGAARRGGRKLAGGMCVSFQCNTRKAQASMVTGPALHPPWPLRRSAGGYHCISSLGVLRYSPGGPCWSPDIMVSSHCVSYRLTVPKTSHRAPLHPQCGLTTALWATACCSSRRRCSAWRTTA